MNKPYIICHMMTAVDGRIDCVMTEQLPGVQEYYSTLDSFDAPTRVSGRVTAEFEMQPADCLQSELIRTANLTKQPLIIWLRSKHRKDISWMRPSMK